MLGKKWVKLGKPKTDYERFCLFSRSIYNITHDLIRFEMLPDVQGVLNPIKSCVIS